MLYIMLFGGLGTLIRYLMAPYLPILLINCLGVILIGLTKNLKTEHKDLIHSGFLGGFTSLSAIYLVTTTNPLTLTLHFVIYYIIYIISIKVGDLYV